jgi:hypothetical protein
MTPAEGSRLKAFIVPAPGAPACAGLRREIAAWIDLTLPVPERPRALSFGPALPVTPTGKPADWPAGQDVEIAKPALPPVLEAVGVGVWITDPLRAGWSRSTAPS